MRILITSPSLDINKNISGISSVLANIIKWQRDKYIVFTSGRSDNEKRDVKWLLNQFFFLIRYIKILRVSNINVVHINSAMSELSIIRDYFLISIAKILRKKIVLHIHGGKYLFASHKPIILKYFIQDSLKKSDQIIVLSELERDNIKNKFNVDNINILQNCIELNHAKTIPFEDKKNVIVFLGRIVKDKGLNEIVEAFRLLNKKTNDFFFELCGVGPDFAIYDNLFNELLGNRYKYNGVVNGSEKWDFLKNAKIFLLPSYYEGLPISLLEAMSTGCIPIVTPVGSIKEVIKDEYNGIIVNKYAPDEIMEAILHIIKNQQVAEYMALNAALTIKERFNILNYKEQLNKIYDCL